MNHTDKSILAQAKSELARRAFNVKVEAVLCRTRPEDRRRAAAAWSRLFDTDPDQARTLLASVNRGLN
jgi:hypothetical protein